MGFGFLLYGYLMLLEAGVLIVDSPRIGFDIFPDLLGYIFFYLAMRKLSPYAMGFKQAKGICWLLFPAGALTLAGQILAWAGIGLSAIPTLLTYTKLATNLLLLFFHFAFLRGIAKLATDVELPKLAAKAKISLIMSLPCYLLAILLQLSEQLIPGVLAAHAGVYSYIGLFYQLLFYAVYFFNLYVIFSAYRLICYEGQEDPDDSNNPLMRLYRRFHRKKDGSDDTED